MNREKRGLRQGILFLSDARVPLYVTEDNRLTAGLSVLFRRSVLTGSFLDNFGDNVKTGAT